MQFTKSHAVTDNRLTTGLSIGNNMSGIEKFGVFQATKGALFAIGIEDLYAKASLVKTLFYFCCDVSAATIIGVCSNQFLCLNVRVIVNERVVINGNGKCETIKIRTYDKHRPDWHIFTWHQAKEIDQRYSALHRLCKPCIVTM